MIASCDVMKVAHFSHSNEPARHEAHDQIEIVIPGEQGSADAIMIALDRGFVEAKARDAFGIDPPPMASRYDGADPFIREVGNSLRAELRQSRVPSAAYLESLAGVIAVHVAANSRSRPRPQRPRAGLAPHKLTKVLAVIEERIADSVSVRQLAGTVHMSPFHFARMFKQAAGHPPHTYITLLRMERAKDLLGNTKLSLVEIAANVGYQTQAHFTGVFHKRVGTTPRAYRRETLAQRGAA